MWKEIKPESLLVRMARRGCRTVSSVVLTDVLDVPKQTSADCDEWSRVLGEFAMTTVGEICNMGLHPTLATEQHQATIDDWLARQGLTKVSRDETAVSLACTAAHFHHDADSYPNKVFCVLWLSDDVQWDLYFPFLDKRIPLVYGTVVLFDSAQPHGVLRPGEKVFDWDMEYATGTFLSQDLIIGKQVRRVMGMQKTARAGRRGFDQLNCYGYQERLDEETGSWSMRKL